MALNNNVELLVLGDGPVSLFIAEEARNRNMSCLIVSEKSENRLGMLKTIDVGQFNINYMPIYPLKSVFQIPGYEDLPVLNTVYSELEPNDYSAPDFIEKSYTEFLISNNKNHKFVLSSEKVFGKIIHSKELAKAQDKTRSHYLTKQCNTRVGFIDGKSAYLKKLVQLEKNTEFITGHIIKIDIDKKIVYLNESTINYDKLVSTIPIQKLYELTGLNCTSKFISAAASFVIFTSNDNLKENEIYYDLFETSTIYRVIIISNKILSVQLSQNVPISALKLRADLHKLLGKVADGLKYHSTYNHKLGYPLDIENSDSHFHLQEILTNNRAFSFGRFGNWEYKDLHELDWTTLYEKIFN